MLPLDIFRSPQFAAANLVTLIVYASLGIWSTKSMRCKAVWDWRSPVSWAIPLLVWLP